MGGAIRKQTRLRMFYLVLRFVVPDSLCSCRRRRRLTLDSRDIFCPSDGYLRYMRLLRWLWKNVDLSEVKAPIHLAPGKVQ